MTLHNQYATTVALGLQQSVAALAVFHAHLEKQERRVGNAKQASTEIRPWKLPLVCFATSDSRQSQEVPNAEHATKESSTQQKVKNALTVQWTRTRR